MKNVKKYIIAFIFSIITMLILETIQQFITYDFKFLIGWWSCMAWYTTLIYYDKKEIFI